jgi:hypothetical protein
MTFGKSIETNKEKIFFCTTTTDPKYSMPRWCPLGLTHSQKRKLQRLRARERKEKEAEKIFNDIHLQFPPPQKEVEAVRATKIENKMATVQAPVGIASSLAEPSVDRPTPES